MTMARLTAEQCHEAARLIRAVLESLPADPDDPGDVAARSCWEAAAKVFDNTRL